MVFSPFHCAYSLVLLYVSFLPPLKYMNLGSLTSAAAPYWVQRRFQCAGGRGFYKVSQGWSGFDRLFKSALTADGCLEEAGTALPPAAYPTPQLGALPVEETWLSWSLPLCARHLQKPLFRGSREQACTWQLWIHHLWTSCWTCFLPGCYVGQLGIIVFFCSWISSYFSRTSCLIYSFFVPCLFRQVETRAYRYIINGRKYL